MNASPVRLELSTQLGYDIGAGGCDFIFNVQAARTARQTVVSESLRLSQDVPVTDYVDPATQSRFLRVHAEPGDFTLRYTAVLDLNHHRAPADDLPACGPLDLPGDVLPFLSPSRYCQSDRLMAMAGREFGHVPASYRQAQAICDWVSQHVTFQSNSSTGATSAIDTLVERVGVCRDFAHLMIALCRASGLPARMASGIDYGADPILGPQDFHAYVEVFVGKRWYLFDPSGTAIPMGFVRFGTGRDATDIAFATMYGAISSQQPVISIAAVPNAHGELIEPQRVADALSTDGV